MSLSSDLAIGLVLLVVLALCRIAVQRDLAITGLAATALAPLCSLLLGTGLVAMGVEWRVAGGLAVLLVVSALIAEIDRRSLIIPDPLVVAVVLLATVAPSAPTWQEKLIGALLLGGFFLLVREGFQRAGRAQALGLGDVKLAAAMGAMLGPQDGLTAVAIAGVATLCGMAWPLLRSANGAPTLLRDATAPFGIGLAAALCAMSALRVWGRA